MHIFVMEENGLKCEGVIILTEFINGKDVTLSVVWYSIENEGVWTSERLFPNPDEECTIRIRTFWFLRGVYPTWLFLQIL